MNGAPRTTGAARTQPGEPKNASKRPGSNRRERRGEKRNSTVRGSSPSPDRAPRPTGLGHRAPGPLLAASQPGSWTRTAWVSMSCDLAKKVADENGYPTRPPTAPPPRTRRPLSRARRREVRSPVARFNSRGGWTSVARFRRWSAALGWWRLTAGSYGPSG
jgi:hypothetical protein